MCSRASSYRDTSAPLRPPFGSRALGLGAYSVSLSLSCDVVGRGAAPLRRSSLGWERAALAAAAITRQTRDLGRPHVFVLRHTPRTAHTRRYTALRACSLGQICTSERRSAAAGRGTGGAPDRANQRRQTPCTWHILLSSRAVPHLCTDIQEHGAHVIIEHSEGITHSAPARFSLVLGTTTKQCDETAVRGGATP